MRIAHTITHYIPGLTLHQMINQKWFIRARHLVYRLTKLSVRYVTGLEYV